MLMTERIDRIEAALTANGATVKALCDLAGINQSTWTRWKAKTTTPNMATWAKVEGALSQLTAPAEQKGAA